MARRQAVRREQLLSGDIAAANVVLLETRRFKLRELMEREHSGYCEELSQKGLSIYNQ
jgi:hypothetical protein